MVQQQETRSLGSAGKVLFRTSFTSKEEREVALNSAETTDKLERREHTTHWMGTDCIYRSSRAVVDGTVGIMAKKDGKNSGAQTNKAK